MRLFRFLTRLFHRHRDDPPVETIIYGADSSVAMTWTPRDGERT